MKTRTQILMLVIVLVLLIPLTASAWSGKCVGVSDGDTISVMHEGKAEKIRLYGIDCPEMGQSFGKRAKQFTSDMVFGKIVAIKPTDRDRYGRTVAWVYTDSIFLNKELLKAGLAWHYKKYSQDDDLAILELVARKKGIGLWSEPRAISPWEFRHEPDKSAVVEDQPISPQPAITPATPRPTESIVYHGKAKNDHNDSRDF